jgi:putative acetyltransferase
MNVHVRQETPADHSAIHAVVADAFGRDEEARLVAALREGGYGRLSLVAELDGQVVGHLLFSDLPIVAEDSTVPALALAPLSVVREHQRRGIGIQLVRDGLDRLRQAGHRIVIVLGHPAYYPRFGFSAQLARQLDSPYAGDSFMALELVEGALEGVHGEVQYAPPFSMF